MSVLLQFVKVKYLAQRSSDDGLSLAQRTLFKNANISITTYEKIELASLQQVVKKNWCSHGVRYHQAKVRSSMSMSALRKSTSIK